MLYTLQYGRAFAALLVVYAHLSGFVQFSPLVNSRIGDFGVDIFFVISGFIMWTTSSESSIIDFWLRRMIRIAPIYWIYTLLLIALALFPGRLAPNVDVTPEAVAKSLFFIPYFNGRSGIQPLLLQGWTLNLEVYFYFVFGLALLLPKLMRLFFLIVVFVLAVSLGTLHLADNALYLTYTEAMILEFLFGIGIAALLPWLSMGLGAAAALVAFSILAFAVVSFNSTLELPRFLAYGLPSMVFIAGLVSLEPLAHRRPVKALALIGDASYSLYLSHPFVLKIVAVAFGNAGIGAADSAPTAIIFAIVAMPIAVVFSILSYQLIERPLGRALGATLVGRRGNLVPASAEKGGVI